LLYPSQLKIEAGNAVRGEDNAVNEAALPHLPALRQ